MVKKEINKFEGEYSFLSNFYPHVVKYNDVEYKSVEHAYQDAKVLKDTEHKAIQNASTPGEAKKLARSFNLRPDWDIIKDGIMYELLIIKFSYSYMAEKLLATKDAILIEGNWWGDEYWGMCKGVGQNKLGCFLMLIREELKNGAVQ